MFIAVILPALFLAGAVSLDTLGTGFGFGAGRVRLPFLHMLVLNAICGVVLGGALFLGRAVAGVFDARVTMWISVLALSSIGIFKIWGWYKNRGRGQAVPPTVSWGKTVSLSVILSIDSIVAGVGASIYHAGVGFCVFVTAVTFVTGFAMFVAGNGLGRGLARKRESLDLSWVAGIVFIVMAVGKVF